jgi:hypothetical protein
MPQSIANQEIQHPAPHASRVPEWLLFTALLAGPIAWFVQLNILYGMAGQTCFPRDEPRLVTPAGFGWLTTALIAINLVALALTVAGAIVSGRNWRRTQEEARGGHGALLDAGEGRTRFLSAWGLWGGSWFIIAILFDTIAAIMEPICGG